ncbi:MAG: hypothetical protein LBE84_08030, partial [Planctomycetota bacterium]|nr:hypothetical protein [Planctomycetota bacterium]
RIKPLLNQAMERKNRLLPASIAIGLSLFVVLAVAVWLFLAPHRELLETRLQLPIWLFVAVPPASFGVVAASLSYLVLLKRIVDRLRNNLLDCLAGFMGPSVFREPAGIMEKSALKNCPEGLRNASPGSDVFRGEVNGRTCRFSNLWLAAGESGKPLTGVFLQVTLAGETPEFIRTVETALPETHNGGLRFFQWRTGDTLNLAILRLEAAGASSGPLASLDLARHRDFCRDARLCLAVLAELASGPKSPHV